MRSAVSELSRALAHLFEMVRAERQSQRVKISALERDLHAAREQLAALGVEPQAAPAPNDFDQLRAAAERLRLRTEQLVRDAHLSSPVPTPPNEDETVASPAQADAPVVDGAPALRVLGESPRSAVAVESELAVDEPEQEPARPEAKAAEAVAVPVARTPAPAAPEPPARPATRTRTEPVAAQPAAEARRGRLRRRRIDARKLRAVEPVAALTTMVAAIDPLWTAGCPIDLVVALTDGGAIQVRGGDHDPLTVREVRPGTSARCTVTATRSQVVPLFGRLAVDGEPSTPLIHGSRRDADLLVGWLDRAQRLPVRPL